MTGEFPEDYAEVMVDARNLDGRLFSGSVELQSRDGKMLKSAPLPEFSGATTARLALDGVAGGEYHVAAKLSSGAGNKTTRTVPFTVYTKPDCVSETAGLGGVIPPWTPLQVKGTAVHCWNRVYAFGDGPFPQSLVSAGENIFTEPPRFVWRVGNRKGELKSGTFTITESSGDKVTFSGRMEDGLFRVDYTGEMEFDGAVFYDMAVKPKRIMEKVDEFALEFRLKPDGRPLLPRRPRGAHAQGAERAAHATGRSGGLQVPAHGGALRRRARPAMVLRNRPGLDAL